MAKYLVVGSLGCVGREIVRRLSERPAEEVAEIRAVDATPAEECADLLPADPRILAYTGDYRQPHRIRPVLEGVRYVFFAVGADADVEDRGSPRRGNGGGGERRAPKVDVCAVAAAARLAKEASVRRFVMVSRQPLVYQAELSAAAAARRPTSSVAASKAQQLLATLLQGEQQIRTSGVEYSIIRLGHLVEAYEGQPRAMGRAPVRCGQRLEGDPASAQDVATTFADAAAVCVASTKSSGARNTTFDVISEDPRSPEESDVPLPTAALFSRLDPEWDLNLEVGAAEPLSAEDDLDYMPVRKAPKTVQKVLTYGGHCGNYCGSILMFKAAKSAFFAWRS